MDKIINNKLKRIKNICNQKLGQKTGKLLFNYIKTNIVDGFKKVNFIDEKKLSNNPKYKNFLTKMLNNIENNVKKGNIKKITEIGKKIVQYDNFYIINKELLHVKMNWFNLDPKVKEHNKKVFIILEKKKAMNIINTLNKNEQETIKSVTEAINKSSKIEKICSAQLKEMKKRIIKDSKLDKKHLFMTYKNYKYKEFNRVDDKDIINLLEYMDGEYKNVKWLHYIITPFVDIISHIIILLKKLYNIIVSYFKGDNNNSKDNNLVKTNEREEKEINVNNIKNPYTKEQTRRLYGELLNQKEKIKGYLIKGLYSVIYRIMMIILWGVILKIYLKIIDTLIGEKVEIKSNNKETYSEPYQKDNSFNNNNNREETFDNFGYISETVDVLGKKINIDLFTEILTVIKEYFGDWFNDLKEMVYLVINHPEYGFGAMFIVFFILYNFIYFMKDVYALSNAYSYYSGLNI